MKNYGISIFILTALFSSLYTSISAQWQSLGSEIIPQDHRIWSIKIAPDQSIWALSTYDSFPPINHVPVLHKSTNEGLSWSSHPISIAESKIGWDIAPIDSLNAFAAFGNAGLYKTTDGGQTWEAVQSFQLYSQAVHFFNNEEGVVIGLDAFNYLVIGFTRNGGKTWRPLGGAFHHQGIHSSLPFRIPGERLPAITFSVNSAYDYHDKSMIIGTSEGGIWATTDRGHNWIRKTTPLSDLGLAVSNVAMKDEYTFLVAGDIKTDDRVGVETVSFVTEDGGESWIRGTPGVTAAASHYIPGTPGTFIIVGHNDFGWGDEGTAISHDFGNSWQIIDGTSLIALDFSSGGLGVGACCNNSWPTANGQIMKWEPTVISSIKGRPFRNDVRVSPNPVHDKLLIETENSFEGLNLDLYIISTNGQILLKEKIPNESSYSLDTSFLPSGVYTVRLQGAKGWAIQKIIKD